jgi:hypothetical protein
MGFDAHLVLLFSPSCWSRVFFCSQFALLVLFVVLLCFGGFLFFWPFFALAIRWLLLTCVFHRLATVRMTFSVMESARRVRCSIPWTAAVPLFRLAVQTPRAPRSPAVGNAHCGRMEHSARKPAARWFPPLVRRISAQYALIKMKGAAPLRGTCLSVCACAGGEFSCKACVYFIIILCYYCYYSFGLCE